MAILQLPDHRSIPRLDEPAKVMGLTILVSVQCQCGAPTLIGLLNAQSAVCEACGAVFSLDSVTWEKGSSTPAIQLSASPSRAQTLSLQ